MTESQTRGPVERPLLTADELEVWLEPGKVTCSGTLTIEASSLVCVGRASALVSALAQPSLVHKGSLLLRGERPEHLLSTGRAGYCPRLLPAPPDFSVYDALFGSARLIGLGPSDVRRALERSEAEGLGKRRLKDLGPLEQRLVGLAHGLTSDPALALLEDPCAGLEDDAAELVLSVVEREFRDRSWILGTELRSPWSRRLALSGEVALMVEKGHLLGPFPPAELASPGAWARFDRVSEALLRGLEQRGGQVVRTPSQDVLLVRRLGGLALADVAAGAGSCLLELTPLTPGD